MRKLSTRRSTTVVGLDIETGSVAAAEVDDERIAVAGGHRRGPAERGGHPRGRGDRPRCARRRAQGPLRRAKLSRNVRVGIANQRVVVRTLRLPLIEDRNEVDLAIRFQAAEHIPMPLDGAVLDWQVLEPTPETAAAKQMDVVVVAARREAVVGITRAVAPRASARSGSTSPPSR